MLIDIRTQPADNDNYAARVNSQPNDLLVVAFTYRDYFAELPDTPDGAAVMTGLLYPAGLGYPTTCEGGDHDTGPTEPVIVIPDYVDLCVCPAHFRADPSNDLPRDSDNLRV